jgi:Flp pilus assembly protein TadG
MKKVLRCEKGSATVEFVALALPLFVPIIFFLHQFASVSGQEEVARTLAREGARAFVTSSGQSSATAAMSAVIYRAGREIGLSDKEFERMAINIECSSSPCYSPNGKIVVTVHFGASKEFRAVTASAQEYLSPWS